MNTRYQKTTAEDIQALSDDSASHTERASAIGTMAYDRLYQYEAKIRELADHPHSFIRAAALFHLIGTWGRADLVDTALRVALHDPSSYTRDEVFTALGNFVKYFQDTDPELVERVITTLVAALLRETDWTQQRIAYDAILEALDGKGFPYVSNKVFNRDTDVDWARLEPYREAAEQLDFTPSEF